MGKFKPHLYLQGHYYTTVYTYCDTTATERVVQRAQNALKCTCFKAEFRKFSDSNAP